MRGSTGRVLLGAYEDGGENGGGDTGACGGNRITGPVNLDANTGGVVLVANQVTGPLRCEGNAPAPHQADDTVAGPRSGQCR